MDTRTVTSVEAETQAGDVFWDWVPTRGEVVLLGAAIVLTFALQFSHLLPVYLCVGLVVALAGVCWLTPFTAFYFIACAQSLPYPEAAPLNPAQLGFVVWLPMALASPGGPRLRHLPLLRYVLPWLVWIMLVEDKGLMILEPTGFWARALAYAALAGHFAAVASGRYVKCLLGLCVGSLSVMAGFWLHVARLPVRLQAYAGAHERAGFERLGSGGADAVMVWPALLVGAFGIVGVAIALMRLRHDAPGTKAMILLSLVTLGLSLPPLLGTMTYSGYAGFALMAAVAFGVLFRALGRSGAGMAARRKLMRSVALILVAVAFLLSLNLFGTRERALGLWGDYLRTAEERSIAASRTDVWIYAFKTMMRYPLFGVKALGRSRTEEIPREYRDEGTYMAHNVFLDQGRRTGVPGLLLSALFFFYPVYALRRRRMPNRYLGFYLAYCAMFIFWMVLSHPFYKTFWALWMLMVVAAATDTPGAGPAAAAPAGTDAGVGPSVRADGPGGAAAA